MPDFPSAVSDYTLTQRNLRLPPTLPLHSLPPKPFRWAWLKSPISCQVMAGPERVGEEETGMSRIGWSQDRGRGAVSPILF